MDNFDIYKGFRARRKALGWSQEYLGEVSGVGRLTIHNTEIGKTIPTIPVIKKIHAALLNGETSAAVENAKLKRQAAADAAEMARTLKEEAARADKRACRLAAEMATLSMGAA
jgi:transcriptional regulator with XRE-family HTH domain